MPKVHKDINFVTYDKLTEHSSDDVSAFFDALNTYEVYLHSVKLFIIILLRSLVERFG
jgi:hypothetical protein